MILRKSHTCSVLLLFLLNFLVDHSLFILIYMMRNKIPFSWNLPQKSFRIINSILNAFTTCTEKNHMQGITLNGQFTTVFLLSIYQQWIATLGLHAKPIFTVRGKESPDKWFWAYTVQHNASQTQLPQKNWKKTFISRSQIKVITWINNFKNYGD